MMQVLSEELKKPLIELLLSIADDKLILGHRASDWTGLAPVLEEDIAFSAISQEEIAHAAALYDAIAQLQRKTADSIALGRKPGAYRCADLVVIPDEFDWARAIVRQFLCDHFDVLRLGRLARADYAPLSALASRLHAEELTHLEHGDTWMVHLGKGSDESRLRMQAALDLFAPHAAMLFEPVVSLDELENAGLYPLPEGDMFDQWHTAVQNICDEADLTIQVSRPDPITVGGRRGKHGDELTTLLDEMCEVYRIEPEAAW